MRIGPRCHGVRLRAGWSVQTLLRRSRLTLSWSAHLEHVDHLAVSDHDANVMGSLVVPFLPAPGSRPAILRPRHRWVALTMIQVLPILEAVEVRGLVPCVAAGTSGAGLRRCCRLAKAGFASRMMNSYFRAGCGHDSDSLIPGLGSRSSQLLSASHGSGRVEGSATCK